MRVCSRCVMDESAPDIQFDSSGTCNFCTGFQRGVIGKRHANPSSVALAGWLECIRRAGHGKPYDCVVGLSGGVDSSYVLHLAVTSGLRPLAVHLDNGWNSELAVANIHALINRLNVDLYTHVIDWDENRDLQLSMFKAHVVDIELLMDNAMLAINHQLAAKYKLKHIVSGSNQATEGIRMPRGWNHFKFDAKNIRQIHTRFGEVPIKTHPLISTLDYLRYKYLNRIEWVSLLDHVRYNKTEASQVLVDTYGYKPYPYKHYESVFTRFYQGHILLAKFGFDKRKVHLSTLIMSGQITREAAIQDLQQPPYDLREQTRDEAYVLKKLGMSKEWFDEYLATPGKSHLEYPSELPRWEKWLKTWGKVKAKVARPG
jgi:N-acetyl sugar amidotransferase